MGCSSAGPIGEGGKEGKERRKGVRAGWAGGSLVRKGRRER